VVARFCTVLCGGCTPDRRVEGGVVANAVLGRSKATGPALLRCHGRASTQAPGSHRNRCHTGGPLAARRHCADATTPPGAPRHEPGRSPHHPGKQVPDRRSGRGQHTRTQVCGFLHSHRCTRGRAGVAGLHGRHPEFGWRARRARLPWREGAPLTTERHQAGDPRTDPVQPMARCDSARARRTKPRRAAAAPSDRTSTRETDDRLAGGPAAVAPGNYFR